MNFREKIRERNVVYIITIKALFLRMQIGYYSIKHGSFCVVTSIFLSLSMTYILI